MADDPQTGDESRTGATRSARFGLPFDISGIDLNEAMRILQSPGPLNWEIARQTAEQVAVESDEDGRADEIDRRGDARRARRAGPGRGRARSSPRPGSTTCSRCRSTSSTGAPGPAATSTACARCSRRWPPRCRTRSPPISTPADDEDVQELTSDMLGMPMGAAGMRGLMGMLGPILLGAQTGSMIGYLAQYALGAYDLPLPSVDAPRITFVAPNIDRFADAWSLDPREVRMAVAITETVRAAQRTRPWVRERLVQIARDYVGAFALDPHAFDDAFGDLDPTDTEAMARIAQRPEVLLGALRNDEQRAILERNQQFTMVLEGHADLVTDEIAAKLLPDAPRIAEALRRHHVERGEAGRFVEGMLGVELDREHYERGHRFCAGVVERAGMAGLNRLLEAPERLPDAERARRARALAGPHRPPDLTDPLATRDASAAGAQNQVDGVRARGRRRTSRRRAPARARVAAPGCGPARASTLGRTPPSTIAPSSAASSTRSGSASVRRHVAPSGPPSSVNVPAVGVELEERVGDRERQRALDAVGAGAEQRGGVDRAEPQEVAHARRAHVARVGEQPRQRVVERAVPRPDRDGLVDVREEVPERELGLRARPRAGRAPRRPSRVKPSRHSPSIA